MSDTNKQEILIDPEDLDADGLGVMRFFSVLGVLAIVAFIGMKLFDFQPKWFYLTAIVVAVLSYMVTSGNSLGDILRGADEHRDEWQRELAMKARSLSFVIVHISLVLSFIMLHIIGFFGVDVALSSDSMTSVFLALVILLFLLPRAVMAWSVKPIPNEPEEEGVQAREGLPKTTQNGLLKTIATFTFAFTVSYLFFRFIN